MSSQFIKYRFLSLAFILIGINLSAQSDKFYSEFDLELKADYRYFFSDGLYEGQHKHYPGFAIEPNYFLEWADGNQSLNFTGFARLDRDGNRTHWDVRELYWQGVKNNWELSLGAKKVFWGVTESVHLVDIVNQTDFVESFDGEQKLGQPMAHLSYVSNIGIFDFFAMPYFRKREFPGREKDRLRTPFINRYEMKSVLKPMPKNGIPDFAFRWSNSMGIFDMRVFPIFMGPAGSRFLN